MWIKILVFDEGEWREDTLESRIVDARLNKLVAEFEQNGVPVKIFRYDVPERREGRLFYSWDTQHPKSYFYKRTEEIKKFKSKVKELSSQRSVTRVKGE